MRFFIVIMLALCPLLAKAQFTIVDADSKETLPGVYVYSETGKLLAMSDENGCVKALGEAVKGVTLSMLSYESRTLNANELHGEIALKGKPFELNEVVVGRTEFLKISAVFRDVVKNFDNLIIYREGLVDYYYNAKSKKYTRVIRGCRQYEHPDLRKGTNDSLAIMYLPLLDFNKVQELHSSGETTHGDTTIVEATVGKRVVKDGIMKMEKNGIYRELVDAMKFLDRSSINFLGLRYTLTKHIIDWQFNDKISSAENLVSFRDYREEDYQWSKKAPVVPITTTSDLVVYSVTSLKTKEAKAEMKDKETTTDFTLPDYLPAIPETIHQQAKTLVLKKFRER